MHDGLPAVESCSKTCAALAKLCQPTSLSLLLLLLLLSSPPPAHLDASEAFSQPEAPHPVGQQLGSSVSSARQQRHRHRRRLLGSSSGSSNAGLAPHPTRMTQLTNMETPPAPSLATQ
jgi:hypothetical protein